MSAVLLGWTCAFAFCVSGTLGIAMLSCMLWLGGSALHARWQPAFVAAARAMVLAVVLYVPVLFGLRAIFAWHVDAAFAAQQWFLNTPFAVARGVIYFSVWLAACRYAAAPAARARTAIALIALFVTANLAAIDWIMALTPTWHSSDFGLRWCVNGLLAGIAAIVVWQRGASTASAAAMRARIDSANLLFAANLGWIYLMFVDYITAWSGNLPDEAAWYAPRISGVWMLVAVAMLAIHCIAGAILLFRRVKRSAAALAAIATSLLVALFIETMWLMIPAHVDSMTSSLSAVVAVGVIGALGFTWLSWLPRRMNEALHRG